MSSPATPLLGRIRIATIAAQDLARTEELYTRWLGYEVRARGTVEAALARSWGAPAAAGRGMLLMSSPGAPDVLIRAVHTDAVPGYQAMTTLGWNSIEIIVSDVHKLHERLKQSPFEILDTPHPLKGYPSIVAMQVKGPSEEVLYLTMETGDACTSILPDPRAFVGRPFIAVLAGHGMDAMLDWYGAQFAMVRRRVSASPIGILQTAQNTGPDHLFPIGTMSLAAHGNLIEFDGYPPAAGPRPRAPGQLPAGNAMYSFSVADLAALKLTYFTPPAPHAAPGYDGRKAATAIGPAGELIELIEE